MIKRLFVILVSSLWLAIPLSAQSNKLIRELEGKRGALQKQIAETESILQNTKKDVGSQLNGLAALTGQIEERKRYILAINNDVDCFFFIFCLLTLNINNSKSCRAYIHNG